MKRSIIILSLLIVVGLSTYAQSKTFIREYFYHASEDDSKNSARAKALIEVRKELLDEVGVYIESYADLTSSTDNSGKVLNFFREEIKSMNAGITETKVLEESWNGAEYYVKAAITLDPTDVVRRLNEAIERRKADVVIDSLNLLLSNAQKDIVVQNERVDKLNGQIADQQKRLAELNAQIAELNKRTAAYSVQEQESIAEVAALQKSLRRMTDKAMTTARIGMTREELMDLCGSYRRSEIILSLPKPNSSDYYWGLNYGGVWIITIGYMDSDFVVWGVTNEDYQKGNVSKAYNVLKTLEF